MFLRNISKEIFILQTLVIPLVQGQWSSPRSTVNVCGVWWYITVIVLLHRNVIRLLNCAFARIYDSES